MHKTNRPIFHAAVGSLVAAAALLTTSCSAPPEPQSLADVVPPSRYTVEHAMGTATLDAVPTRIVVIDSPQLDALVSLGITPVGATVSGSNSGFPEYIASDLNGTAVVGATSEPDIDAIANLEPDLIIGSKVRHEAIFSELQSIAPTVFSENSGTDWHEQALITAAAVDQTPEMTSKLSDLDARAISVGESVGAAKTTISMVRFRPDNFRLYGPGSFSGSILTQAGFDLGARDWNEYSMMELSPELFENIDGDVIFYTNRGGDPSATTLGSVSGLWGNLSAVKADRVHEVEDETWMVGIGVVGANMILDDVETMLR